MVFSRLPKELRLCNKAVRVSPFANRSAKYRSDASRIWETRYEHIILPVGRSAASNYMQDPVISNSSNRMIEQWATEFGTVVFLGKFWVEGP